MSFKFQYKKNAEPDELEITSFMNLMIVLVPVLLLSMSFTQITVLDVSLPELTGGYKASEMEQSKLEVRIDQEGFKVFFPDDKLVKTLPVLVSEAGSAYDFAQLSLVVQELKQQVPDKRDVLLLAEPNVDYQSLVFTMDALRSYKTVVAASVVEVELFPEIALGDNVKK
ncbi:MAG TPA: biopolymer transporter ExbD [Cellvibrio sp.]|nr:biopolymer transporter ExbD [Cellvibrio sp.]